MIALKQVLVKLKVQYVCMYVCIVCMATNAVVGLDVMTMYCTDISMLFSWLCY